MTSQATSVSRVWVEHRPRNDSCSFFNFHSSQGGIVIFETWKIINSFFLKLFLDKLYIYTSFQVKGFKNKHTTHHLHHFLSKYAVIGLSNITITSNEYSGGNGIHNRPGLDFTFETNKLAFPFFVDRCFSEGTRCYF